MGQRTVSVLAYDGMTAYAQSKACDRMLTWAFARRLQEESVTVNRTPWDLYSFWKNFEKTRSPHSSYP